MLSAAVVIGPFRVNVVLKIGDKMFILHLQREEEMILQQAAAQSRVEATKIMSMEPSEDEDDTTQMGTGTGTGSASFSRSIHSTLG